MSATNLPVRVAAYMAADLRGAHRINHFSVHTDRDSDNPWRNYAVPDSGAEPTADDVAELIEYFESRQRTPRLEYVPDAAPAVEPALLAAGFVAEGRGSLRGCRPGEPATRPAPDGFAITLATTDDDLRAVIRVQNDAYGSPGEPTGADLDRMHRLIGNGGIVGMARDLATGSCAGAGLCTAPLDRVSELAAVAVAESYRRRGIATVVTAFLARSMHERGADLVWLEQEPGYRDQLYAAAGFTTAAGSKLWISRPTADLRST